MKKIRVYFFTGLIASLPFFLTIFILVKTFQTLITQIDVILPMDKITKMFLKYFTGNIFFAKKMVLILTYLLTFLFIYIFVILLGIMLIHFISAEKVKLIEEKLLKIPLIKPLYNTLKQIREVIFSKKNKSYKKVVLIEYPRKGIYSLGFLTNEEENYLGEINKEKIVNIFIPTSPNPTSGMFIMAPAKEITEIDITIEEAIKLIISCGAIIPKIKENWEGK
ncbi:MAG: hypothetical protein B6I28_03115 [Fusobacteriia bacterium 4572_132]|nr:MAG: hypothetical protein B6I28_03115 [Fusobacteriia bacterium 4572_132]